MRKIELPIKYPDAGLRYNSQKARDPLRKTISRSSGFVGKLLARGPGEDPASVPQADPGAPGAVLRVASSGSEDGSPGLGFGNHPVPAVDDPFAGPVADAVPERAAEAGFENAGGGEENPLLAMSRGDAAPGSHSTELEHDNVASNEPELSVSDLSQQIGTSSDEPPVGPMGAEAVPADPVPADPAPVEPPPAEPISPEPAFPAGPVVTERVRALPDDPGVVN